MSGIKYILAGWLIDGSGDPVQNKVLITINNGMITSITPATEIDHSTMPITDLSHCTILPPLVDAHVHLFMSGTTCMKTRENQLVAGYEELRPVIRRHLHDLHSHGVLAARDAGDFGGYAARYKTEPEMHQEVNLKVAGKAWRGTKRYGRLIGRTPGKNQSLTEAFSQNYEDDPTDLVKLVNSGLNSLHIFGKQTKAQFSVTEIQSLVDAARRQGKKVMVHANGVEPVRSAIEGGCHSIEHGFFMGRENLELMAKKNVVWVPTLYTMKAYSIHADKTDATVDLAVIQKNLEHQIKQLSLARELGVRVALGTDAGSMGVLHGEAVVEEIKLYRKAGYSLPEVIQCVTQNGAELLDIDEFGFLGIGRRASFLVSRGSPAQLPRKLSYLESIYIDGSPSELYHKNPVKHVL